MLPAGHHPLAPGMIADVVTYLEMNERPILRPVPPLEGLSITRPVDLRPATYRDLFHAVGGPWLWSSRLKLSDEALAAIIGRDDVEVYALFSRGEASGMLELDFRQTALCDLAFFGLVPALLGTGAGRFLMNHALERAWSREPAIRRMTVNTCTLDHQQAVPFYMRSGFVPYRRAIEIAADPRLGGTLPRDAASWFPIV